jgi:hypothetical protein
MATENRGWDSSTAHIKRTLRACIERGRRSGGRDDEDLWEAYRLLGTALHTLEDLLAHSNWCEVALRKIGHEQVFCHVGDNGTPHRRQLFQRGDWSYCTLVQLSLTRPTVKHPHSLLASSAPPISCIQ